MKLPQLTLRELFLLVALMAMGCGWWVDRRGLTQELATFHRTMWYTLPDDDHAVFDFVEGVPGIRPLWVKKPWPMPENPYQPPKETPS